MAKVYFIYRGSQQDCDFLQQGPCFDLSMGEVQLKGEIIVWEAPYFKIKLKDKVMEGFFFRTANFVDIHLRGTNLRVQFPKKTRQGAFSDLPQGDILAPMPGKILKLLVEVGETVKVGDCLMVIEAMKMEHKILSPCPGQVEKIFFKENDRVSQGDELIKIEETSQ